MPISIYVTNMKATELFLGLFEALSPEEKELSAFLQVVIQQGIQISAHLSRILRAGTLQFSVELWLSSQVLASFSTIWALNA